MALETEARYYNDHRSDFVKEHDGKFALIKGDRCMGFYDTSYTAYQAGVSQFGLEPFMIHEVVQEEPIHQLPAYYLGLTHASL
ncbi:MAG: hypothetical protein AABZ08_04185 [Planctomycetota bacterium]